MSLQIYNDPVNGSESSVGAQLRTDKINKKALVEAAKETYFGQLAAVEAMPKHMGKKIKRYHYMPILDDRNINDQGLDANGATVDQDVTIIITNAEGRKFYAVGTAGTEADAVTAAKATAVDIFTQLGVFNTDYATTKAALLALNPAWVFSDDTVAAAVPAFGNLYGSSKDIGYIQGKMPVLSENGGRVNRVGMTRLELEGTIAKFGFFDEYTQESLDFDTDEELMSHITSEMVKAANEMTEDQLQIDLLNAAGVIRYTGIATSVDELQGDTAAPDKVVYDDFVKLGIELTNNRCPKNTKLITGSRMVDTKVVNSARYMYIGAELQPSLMKMKDYHDGKAFLPVAQYGAAGHIARGEIGAVDDFRMIVVPEMMKWAGAGAAVGTNGGYYETGGNYDVFPMLVVGSGSFTTIGFQTDGKTVKFKIKHRKPDDNYSSQDPYGETGFYSIKWYYGFMALRQERIAVIKTVAEI